MIFLGGGHGAGRNILIAIRQPHWTLLCIPADNTEDSSRKIGASPTSQELLGPAAAELDLSHAHLQLCLALELPLVIVITKYDLATKAGLRQTLSKLLSILKDVGRRPCIVSDTSTSVTEANLKTIPGADLLEANHTLQMLTASPLSSVPLLLTSAVKGTGIQKLHAFLRKLPAPAQTVPPPTSPSPLFYIEDVYSVRINNSTNCSVIIGGYIRYGCLTIGDELLLGPYPIDVSSDDSDSGSAGSHMRKASMPASRSFPGALNRSHFRHNPTREQDNEWRRVRVTSLRNLRLPVRELHAGQVGTIGIEQVDKPIFSPSINRTRKGMVLAAREPKASKVITVQFEGAQAQGIRELSVGSAIVLYVASVRASSKVISIASEPATVAAANIQDDDEEDSLDFGFDDEPGQIHDREQPSTTVVTFQFIASQEFVEIGAKVLVMPGGGPGFSGGLERSAKGLAVLEGFVGRVIEE